MGNGVKEGAVRLREDAEAVLSSPVSSKASTWPPGWALSQGPSSVLLHLVTNRFPHTEVGAASVRHVAGGGGRWDTGRPPPFPFRAPFVMWIQLAQPLAKKPEPRPNLECQKVSLSPFSHSDLQTQKN